MHHAIARRGTSLHADRANNLRKDRDAIEAMAGVLEGKPLVFASGIGGVVRGRPVTEPALDAPDRAGNEAFALADKGLLDDLRQGAYF